MGLRKNNIRPHKIKVDIWKQKKNVSTLHITRLHIIASEEEEKLLQYRWPPCLNGLVKFYFIYSSLDEFKSSSTDGE